MRIDHLYFEHFRNLRTQRVIPAAAINICWGENGQGKTNLLEGIYLFAYLKSFRGAGNAELINSEQDQAKISLNIERSRVLRQLDLELNKNGRVFYLDGKKPRPVENLLDAIRAILFSPDELYPLKTLPAARRSLIDRGIFQLDPSYMAGAIEYDRILKQRNRLLRERESEDMIRPWTDQLIRSGAKIRQARNSFIEKLQPYLYKAHEFLSTEREAVEILYPVIAAGLQQHEEMLFAELQSLWQREMRMGVTLCGPHRDDPAFLLNGSLVRYVASQGQWRTLILSFKLALFYLLHARIGAMPILLFDDMSAELDASRLERLFSLLADCNAQVFITTTNPQPFIRCGTNAVNTFQMVDGEIFPE